MKTTVTPPEYPDLKIKKIVTDEEQQHMRTDLIKPKEYKERG